VLEVGHERLGPRLHVDEAQMVLVIEARGPAHCEEVISSLRAVGYTLALALGPASRRHPSIVPNCPVQPGPELYVWGV
jgi:hypothetical protein